MSLTKRVFLLYLLTIFGCIFGGFYLGTQYSVNWFLKTFGTPNGESIFFAAFVSGIWGLIGVFIGLLLSLLLIRRLGKKYGERLNEENELGKHPVLKLTLLSFLTFLFLLFFLAWLFSLKP